MAGRIALVIVLVYLIPSVLLLVFGKPALTGQSAPHAAEQISQTQNSEQQEQTVRVLCDGTESLMALEEYVLGVTLAEMPSDFEMEALKAQAVVARTFTCKRMQEPKHQECAVCTDPSCCQAYIAPAAFLEEKGSAEAVEKVKQAVLDTAGQVLMYQGSYIEATYFSCSGGRTEDAQAVWGSEVPYLQSVESPGEEQAAHYTDTVSFSAKEFLSRLGLNADKVEIGSISYTDGGGVAYVSVCGKTFSGTQIRQMLGLRSTAIVITAVGERVSITTRGFGHRVGMSQYGAEAMAVQGSDYREILQHYYQGTDLSSVDG